MSKKHVQIFIYLLVFPQAIMQNSDAGLGWDDKREDKLEGIEILVMYPNLILASEFYNL